MNWILIFGLETTQHLVNRTNVQTNYGPTITRTIHEQEIDCPEKWANRDWHFSVSLFTLVVNHNNSYDFRVYDWPFALSYFNGRKI